MYHPEESDESAIRADDRTTTTYRTVRAEIMVRSGCEAESDAMGSASDYFAKRCVFGVCVCVDGGWWMGRAHINRVMCEFECNGALFEHSQLPLALTQSEERICPFHTIRGILVEITRNI